MQRREETDMRIVRDAQFGVNHKDQPRFGVADVDGRGRLERRKTEHQEIRGERTMMG